MKKFTLALIALVALVGGEAFGQSNFGGSCKGNGGLKHVGNVATMRAATGARTGTPTSTAVQSESTQGQARTTAVKTETPQVRKNAR